MSVCVSLQSWLTCLGSILRRSPSESKGTHIKIFSTYNQTALTESRKMQMGHPQDLGASISHTSTSSRHPGLLNPTILSGQHSSSHFSFHL